MRDMRKANTWWEVRQISRRPGEKDAIDHCTALYCCQRILGPSVLRLPFDEGHELCRFISAKTDAVIRLAPQLEPVKRARCIITLLLALARLHFRLDKEKLLTLCDLVYECLPAASQQGTANLAFALALLDATDWESTALLPALSKRCLEYVRFSQHRHLQLVLLRHHVCTVVLHAAQQACMFCNWQTSHLAV